MKRSALVLILIPGLVYANAPDTSLRPKARPVAVSEASDPAAAPYRSLRPKARPTARSAEEAAVSKVVVEQTITEDILVRKSSASIANPPKDRPAQPAAVTGIETVVAAISTEQRTATKRVVSPFAVARSMRPQGRPKGLRTALLDNNRPVKTGTVRYSKRGSVCGIRGLRGRHVPPVRGKGGCGIPNAVRLSEVDGVKLTREALIGCDAAKSLYGWVNKKAKPIVGRRGGGLSKIQLIAGYSCRTRNSRKGAKLSEHAKGKAVDIAGFVLKNGQVMSVLRDWSGSSHSKTMRRLHKSACGPWGTVLGPNADRFHRDHFHFDVASHRSGAYCR
ncbi:MAG: extensin family protein [Pseudomonadota bacterium]